MDYQFSHDILSNPVAKCDIEYEALGDWLSNDVVTDKHQIEKLFTTIDSLLERTANHDQHNGKIYHLIFDQEEVELFLNNNQTTHPEFIDEEETNLEQAICGVGLVDFKHLLTEWLAFLD